MENNIPWTQLTHDEDFCTIIIFRIKIIKNNMVTIINKFCNGKIEKILCTNDVEGIKEINSMGLINKLDVIKCYNYFKPTSYKL